MRLGTKSIKLVGLSGLLCAFSLIFTTGCRTNGSQKMVIRDSDHITITVGVRDTSQKAGKEIARQASAAATLPIGK